MKIDGLMHAAEVVCLQDRDRPKKECRLIREVSDTLLPVGTKLYALEQVLPVIHQMAREILRLEVELAQANEDAHTACWGHSDGRHRYDELGYCYGEYCTARKPK